MGGGGGAHLVGVTKLSRMLGNDPNCALSLLIPPPSPTLSQPLPRIHAPLLHASHLVNPYNTGSSSSSRQGRSSSNTNTCGGARSPPQCPQAPPPPKAPKTPTKPSHFDSKEEEAPPPPRTPPQGQGQGQAASWRIGAGTPRGTCRVWGTPSIFFGPRGATGGPSAKGRCCGIGMRSSTRGNGRGMFHGILCYWGEIGGGGRRSNHPLSNNVLPGARYFCMVADQYFSK